MTAIEQTRTNALKATVARLADAYRRGPCPECRAGDPERCRCEGCRGWCPHDEVTELDVTLISCTCGEICLCDGIAAFPDLVAEMVDWLIRRGWGA